MFLLIQLLSFIHFVSGDLVPEYPEYYPNVSEDNIIAASLWTMGMCTCIGVVCKHKNKLPITISPDKMYDPITVKYAIEKKDGKSIKKFKNDLDEFKKIIDSLYTEEKEKEDEKIKQEKKIEDWIEHSIRFKFGNGEIRYKEGDKYYHGIGINDKQKWNKDNCFDKCFFEYISEKKISKKRDWDTYNANEFCNNCLFDKGKTGKARNYKVYKCNGHEV